MRRVRRQQRARRRRAARWRLGAADLIDWFVALVGFVVACALYGAIRPHDRRRWPPVIVPAPPPARRAASAGALVLAVLAEAGASPGARLAGVQPIVLSTGAPVGLRRAVLRVGLARIAGPLARSLTPRDEPPAQEATVAEVPSNGDNGSEHVEEPSGAREELRALLREQGAGFWPALIRQLVAVCAAGIAMRALRDRVAGPVLRARR